MSVYLLWREDWDYRSVESVHASLDGAKAALLDAVYPLAGPRGGKRPPRPDPIVWREDAAFNVTVLGDGDWTIEPRLVLP